MSAASAISAEDRYELPAILDVTAAIELKARVRAGGASAIVLDARNVERVGAQFLQVLLAASFESDPGTKLKLVDRSDRFDSDLRLLGFDAATFEGGADSQ